MQRFGIDLPEPSQWIFYCKEISEDHMADLYDSIAQKFDRKKRANIALFLNCRGGSIDQAIGFYYWIKAMKINLVTIGMGQISSAALILYLAGQQRYLLPNTNFYFHAGTAGTSDSMHPNEANGTLKNFNRQNKITQEIVVQETRLTMNMVKKYDSETYLMLHRTAIHYGIAHQLIGANLIPAKKQLQQKNKLRLVK